MTDADGDNEILLQYPLPGLSPILPLWPYEDHCERFFPTFNASGTYSLGPTVVNDDWSVGGNATEDLSWTIGVSQLWNSTVNQTGTLTFGFLNQPPGIDLRAPDLPYSGCAIFMGGLQNNTIFRGQTDNGDCGATFGSECVKAIINQTEALALSIVTETVSGTPATPDNLVPQVCLQIVDGLAAKGAVPPACSGFVSKNMTWSDGELSLINMQFTYTEITGPNSTVSETCSVNTTESHIDLPPQVAPGSLLSMIGETQEFYPATEFNSSAEYEQYSEMFYQNGTTWVYPIITVFFPPANTSKTGYGPGDNHTLKADAYMTCARPVNITEGSRVPDPLPAPTSLPKKPMSGGAKAGIAIGVILFVLLLGSLLGLFLWQRKKKRAAQAKAAEEEREVEEEKKARMEEENKQEAKSPMLDSDPVQRFELGEEDRKPEVDSSERFEMEGSPVAELGGNTLDQELEGTKSGKSLSLDTW